MTSQAILGESLNQIATQTKSNVSNSEKIGRSDNNSFHRVMEHSQADQTKYSDNRVDRNNPMDGHRTDRHHNTHNADRSHMDKAIADKRAEIAAKLSKHIDKQSNPQMSKNEVINSKPFVKEEFVSDVKDVINDVAHAYKEALEIEDEELISIMEQLGINLFQLPLQDIVKDIVLEVNGESDITGLLVNEEALNSLNTIKDFLVSYNPEEKLNMSLEEFSDLVQEAVDRLMNLDGEVSNSEFENADIEVNLTDNTLNMYDEHISADEIVDNLENDMLDMDVNVEDNGLNNQVIQDDSIINNNIEMNNSGLYNSSEDASKDASLYMNSIDKNKLQSKEYTISSEVEVGNKKISVEITKSTDDLASIDNKKIDGDMISKSLEYMKNDNINVNNDISTQDTDINLTSELSVDDLVQNEDIDTQDTELDKGINNEDVNEYILERKDSLVADKTESDTSSDMMSEGKETGTEVKNSNQVDSKEVASEFYDKFIANLEKSFGVSEADVLNEMSHIREMREVVEQLVEKIKVNINKDTTTMKMQLAPEHLGKLELEITSKSGVLTAQIKVENATAKEAIESGLQTLIQKFDEQGVKVEAVEVSIANYDMSKENGRDRSSKDYEMDIKKKKRQDKGLVDEISATIILQSYMEQKRLGF